MTTTAQPKVADPAGAPLPVVVRTRGELVAARASLGPDVAVVMTMGALHEGHATLIRRARENAHHVIVTIFLNPLQFGPKEDLSKYPRTFDGDMDICRLVGVDVVFAPTPDVVYPEGDPGVRISAGPLGDVLEGQARPGHFDGMLTVVAKLMNLTGGNSFYFGQKDAQQLLLIRRMVRDLDFPAQVVSVPTVREVDGLAMSSRNTYLTPSDREVALCLSRALRAGADAAAEGPSTISFSFTPPPSRTCRSGTAAKHSWPLPGRWAPPALSTTPRSSSGLGAVPARCLATPTRPRNRAPCDASRRTASKFTDKGLSTHGTRYRSPFD